MTDNGPHLDYTGGPMQATLLYFSQTGNTRKVAKVIAEELTENGCETTTLPLKKRIGVKSLLWFLEPQYEGRETVFS
jgi:hypothetical protein